MNWTKLPPVMGLINPAGKKFVKVRTVDAVPASAPTTISALPSPLMSPAATRTPAEKVVPKGDRLKSRAWAPAPLKGALRLLWPDETPASKAELVEALDRASRLRGWNNAWTAPAFGFSALAR